MFDHVRRAVAVVLTAMILIAAPQIAHAAFSGRAAPTLAVGTASLTTPTDVGATSQCTTGFLSKGARVSITGFTDSGLANTEYVYTLTRGNTQVDTETSTSRSVVLTAANAFTLGTFTFRVTIEPRLQNTSWTGPVWSRTFTC